MNKPNAQSRDTASPADDDFETLFSQNYTRIYGVLFRLVGDRAEAEDLALETFWKYWQRPPARAENIVGWLYRVATNLGYNALRAAKRRTKYEEAAGRDALEFSSPPEPSHETDRRADRQKVRRVLEKLSERDAQLLALRHSGFAYKEIAEALGVAPTSVGTLLARAEKEFERLYHETSD